VLYLRFGQAIPFERLARLLGDLFGLAISEGALANILAQTAPAFRTQSDLIKARLLAGTALESDETSARVGKRTFWTWVFHHGDSACFVIRPSRGKKVVAEFLGDARPEFWVSDRFGAQMGWATKHHQACVAHMLRDARYAIDCGDDAFAPGLEALLRRAARIGRRRPALADATLAAYHSRLQRDLDRLLQIVHERLQRVYTVLLLKCEYTEDMGSLIERERTAKEEATRSLTRFFSRLQKTGRIITAREPRVLALALYAYVLGLHTDYLRSPELYRMPDDTETLTRYFFAPLKPTPAP